MSGQIWLAALMLAVAPMVTADAPSPDSPTAAAVPAGGVAAATPHPAKLYLKPPRPIPVAPRGSEDLVAALEAKLAVPLSLAAADFDEDGVPDVIAGFAHGKSGILSLHRGNIDAIYPNEPEAKQRRAEGTFVEAGFLPDARVFPTPEPPDFVAAGDFDADGHWDVVAIRAGGTRLHFHRGDGHGELGAAETIPLPGPMTAAVSGEINRRDGLEDLVVAVDTPAGPKALVYEWPWGALLGTPEELALPAPATALALGKLEGRLPRDLVITAGSELILVEGRDRRLPYSARTQVEVGPPKVRATPLVRPGIAVALGDFVSGDGNEIAVLTDDGHLRIGRPEALEELATAAADRGWILEETARGAARLRTARVSHAGGDDLIVVDRKSGRGHVIFPERAAEPSEAGQRPDARRIGHDLGALPVDLLPMRLNRDAIDDLLVLSQGGKPLLEAVSYPESTFVVTNTNDSGPGSLRDAFYQGNNGAAPYLIEFAIPGPPPYTIVPTPTNAFTANIQVTIDAMTQPGYAGTPVVIIDGSSTIVTYGLTVSGLGMVNANGSVVRGLAINRFAFRNLDAEDAAVTIEGCYVGFDLSGLVGDFPFGGSAILGAHSVVGGTASPAWNLINALSLHGMGTVQGSRIGIDASGSGLWGGLGVDSDSTVGGTVAGARNLLGSLYVHGTGNVVQGNYVGANADGSSSLGSITQTNVDGDLNTVGGGSINARNLLAGDLGVIVTGQSHVLMGNYIGTDVTGTLPLHLDSDCIHVQGESQSCLIRGNLIGGCDGAGIRIAGYGAALQVLGNFIGTTAAGSMGLGNGQQGIAVEPDGIRSGTIIGGTSIDERNVIASNGQSGMLITGDDALNTQILGNYIGTDRTVTLALGNGGHGVEIQGAPATLVGGTTPEEGNVIRHNLGAGVCVKGTDAISNFIFGNSIQGNGGLGIDLNCDGVTPNDDPDDADVGPNYFMNFPTLTFATTSSGDVTVGATLQTEANREMSVDFYASPFCDDPSGHGEGARYLGTSEVTTDGTGFVDFRDDFIAPGVAPGESITAVARLLYNTSEFSSCLPALGVPPGIVTDLRFELPGSSMAWDPVPGAMIYDIYRGLPPDLTKLITQEVDSCRRWSTPQTTTGNIVTETPPAGQFLWFLVIATGPYGQGEPAEASSGPRQLDPSGDCLVPCPHDKCVTGGKLKPTCGACEAQVCQVDPYCCDTEWDGICVGEVLTVCDSVVCPGSHGVCAHSLCVVGGPLASKCDAPPVVPSCTEAVCLADPYCCQAAWDSTCIAEVTSICGLTCN